MASAYLSTWGVHRLLLCVVYGSERAYVRVGLLVEAAIAAIIINSNSSNGNSER